MGVGPKVPVPGTASGTLPAPCLLGFRSRGFRLAPGFRRAVRACAGEMGCGTCGQRGFRKSSGGRYPGPAQRPNNLHPIDSLSHLITVRTLTKGFFIQWNFFESLCAGRDAGRDALARTRKTCLAGSSMGIGKF